MSYVLSVGKYFRETQKNVMIKNKIETLDSIVES
jgi:hypothetical protein